jgi:hypothetical protein
MVEKGEKGLTDSLTGALLQGDTRASSVSGLAGPAVVKKCPVTVDAGGEVLGGVCECGDCKVWIDEDIGLVPIASVHPFETMMGLELFGKNRMLV